MELRILRISHTQCREAVLLSFHSKFAALVFQRMNISAHPYDKATSRWETIAVLELRREYDEIVRERKLVLRPCLIELVDSQVFWGRWNTTNRTIELAKNLVKNQNWYKVRGVLLHEMAHQWVSESLNAEVIATGETDHGPRFKEACIKLGIPHPFDRASIDLSTCPLDWRENPELQATGPSFLIQRVQKLLALAQSSNEFEAKLAVRKVQEIYARYNLQVATEEVAAEIFHIHIETHKKKMQSFVKRILSILMSHFYVHVVVTDNFLVETGERHKMIELIGRRENVLMAEYVYFFLKQHTELLLRHAVKENPHIWHPVARRSFRIGVISGFDESLSVPAEISKAAEDDVIERSLAIFDKDRDLKNYIGLVFPRLRTMTGARQSVNASAFHSGREQGRALRLKKSMESRTSSTVQKLLTRT